jgi:hypothetical protein
MRKKSTTTLTKEIFRFTHCRAAIFLFVVYEPGYSQLNKNTTMKNILYWKFTEKKVLNDSVAVHF